MKALLLVCGLLLGGCSVLAAQPTPAEGYWCYGGLALPNPHPSPAGTEGELPCTQDQVDYYVHLHPEFWHYPGWSPSPSASGWWCWHNDVPGVKSAALPDPHPSPLGSDRPCTQAEVDHLVYGKPWPDDQNNDGVVDAS
jgi:hypothetical protein